MNQVQQKQTADLKGALSCCETAIEAMGTMEITIKDGEDILRCYGWLQTVKGNVEQEIERIKLSKNSESVPDAADEAVAAPV